MYIIFTLRNSSCGKVMFSQASVCPHEGRGHAWQRDAWQGGHVWQGEHAWWGCVAGGMHGRRDSHCSVRYASYLNVFLFLNTFLLSMNGPYGRKHFLMRCYWIFGFLLTNQGSLLSFICHFLSVDVHWKI